MTKKRLRFYLETSFWRRLADDHSPIRREASYRLLRFLAGRHQILVSRLVVDEIGRGLRDAARRSLYRRMDRSRPRVLPETDRIRVVSARILAEGGWRERMRAGAVHIAFAMIGSADALVTWDAADIARSKTRDVVRKVALSANLPIPELLTPEEVLKWLHVATP